jgi:hypothetical protein
MKKEQEIQSELITVTSTKLSGRAQNRKLAQPDPKTRADTGKLVWKGSPLSKELLMRLIERVQES